MRKICLLILLTSSMAYSQSNTFPSTGNVGIGTTSPGAKLSFPDVNTTSASDGITWYNSSPLGYGIFRTPGAWNAPDYQQLKLQWATGITLEPGSAYGKSYVDIQGGGLRVTSGNVGIGTASPSSKLVIDGIDSYTDGVTIQNTASYKHLITGYFDGNYPTTGSALQFKVANNNTGGNTPVMTLKGSGYVGIGITSPAFQLDVQGFGARIKNVSTNSGSYTTYRIQGPDYTNGLEIDFFGNNNISSDLNWSYGGGAGSAAIINVNAKPLTFGTSNQGRMIIDASGNVGIGTINPNQKLTVNGTIYGKEVKVDLSVPGPDYVFEKDYNLPSLEEIKKYIDENKHLPEVPSAKEMETNGVNLGNMDMLLLKKIEELTLYVIELKKENEEIKKQLKNK